MEIQLLILNVISAGQSENLRCYLPFAHAFKNDCAQFTQEERKANNHSDPVMCTLYHSATKRTRKEHRAGAQLTFPIQIYMAIKIVMEIEHTYWVSYRFNQGFKYNK